MAAVVMRCPGRPRERWPLVAGLLLFLAILAAIGTVSLHRTAGTLIYPDDGYIAMAAARQLLAHGQWGVTPFEFGGSVTSLIWPPLLALGTSAAGHRDAAPFALNVVFGLALVALAQRELSRYLGPGWRFAVIALIILATPLPALALLGLEHSLQTLAATALALAAARACVTTEAQTRRRLLVLTAACATVAVATRYDTASVLAGVLIVTLVTLGWRPAIAIAACAAIPPALYAVVAHAHGWPPVPLGILLKGRLLEFGPSGDGPLRLIASGVHALNGTPALEALVVAALGLLVALLRVREPDSREPRLLLTIFLVAATLHVLFGRTGVPFRYEAYLMALGLFVDAAALAIVVRRLAPRRAIVWTAVAIALYALTTRAIDTHTLIADLGRESYEHEYQQGRFLATYPQPGAVMIVDLGAIAYLSDLRLVDLGALGSLEVAQHELSRTPAWTADGLRRLAAAHDVRVAIDVQGPFPLPAEWVRVAAWIAPDQEVEFFAVDAAAVPALARDLRAFEPELPRAIVLRMFVD